MLLAAVRRRLDLCNALLSLRDGVRAYKQQSLTRAQNSGCLACSWAAAGPRMSLQIFRLLEIERAPLADGSLHLHSR